MGEMDEDEYYRLKYVRMARTIYETYGDIIGSPEHYQWDATDGTISDYTRQKFLAIAVMVMDKIEWSNPVFLLAKQDEA